MSIPARNHHRPHEALLAPVTHRAREAAGLRLLVLFGSRSRRDEYERSDWDFGYLADPSFDPDAFLVDLTRHLKTDEVDLVDLDRAGGVLRFRVASEAQVLYEAKPDLFADFWFQAVSFWCDAEPILEAAHREVLDRVAEKARR